MLDLEDSYGKISFEDFIELENLVKSSFPQVFKKIYLHNNGGFPSKTEFDGDDFCFSIGGFNPIRYGNPSIESLIKDLNRGDGVMQGLVPFAYDDMAISLCCHYEMKTMAKYTCGFKMRSGWSRSSRRLTISWLHSNSSLYESARFAIF